MNKLSYITFYSFIVCLLSAPVYSINDHIITVYSISKSTVPGYKNHLKSTNDSITFGNLDYEVERSIKMKEYAISKSQSMMERSVITLKNIDHLMEGKLKSTQKKSSQHEVQLSWHFRKDEYKPFI